MAPRDPDNINVRLGDEALAALDRLVAARQAKRPGATVTRSEVVREAVLALEAADKKRRRK